MNKGITGQNSVKQAEVFENIRVSNVKQSVIKKAMDALAAFLQPIYGTAQLSINDDHLIETDRNLGHFAGVVSINASVNTSEGQKSIALPVLIDKEAMTLPNMDLVQKRFASVKGSVAMSVEEKIKYAQAKIAEIEKRETINQQITERVVKGEDLKTVTAELRDNVAPIKKEATDYEYSDGEGAVIDKSLTQVPLTLHYNKVSLPDTIKVGDTISITGLRYKVTGSSPALSSGKDDGSQWILSLMI